MFYVIVNVLKLTIEYYVGLLSASPRSKLFHFNVRGGLRVYDNYNS